MSYKFTNTCLKFSSIAIFLLLFHPVHAQSKKAVKEIGTTRFSELDELVQSNQKLLGENVVAGRVDPDEFLLFKPAIEGAKDPVVRRKLGAKQTRIVSSARAQSGRCSC